MIGSYPHRNAREFRKYMPSVNPADTLGYLVEYKLYNQQRFSNKIAKDVMSDLTSLANRFHTSSLGIRDGLIDIKVEQGQGATAMKINFAYVKMRRCSRHKDGEEEVVCL